MAELTTTIAWDGTHEEGIVERPGHTYPWVYVIQPSDDSDRFVWAVYSQSRFTAPFWDGTADTVDAARTAAADAPDTPRRDAGVT